MGIRSNGESGPPAPKSVLDELTKRTGADAKLMLDGSDSVQVGGSPYVDAKSVDRSLLPAGKGNYQILGEIARGGMGTVLKGHDTDLGRDVAVKVLEKNLAENPAVLQRFVEEAQIGGQLQHPGIVPVYELGLMSDDRPYFTMKLIKGRTLSALLAARRSLDEDRMHFLKIFESVCQTVAYAHSKGVIHRDLKPANIMVGAFGEVQVVDWGLAKVLKRGGVEDEKRVEEMSKMTVIETVRSGPGSSGTDSVVGSVMGTPAYMPPEQAMGDLAKVDETSDVFSLGAVLCEILTGKPPYVDEDRRRVVEMASQAELDPARERIESSGADPELAKLCITCLAPSRMARPRNAEDVAKRVHDFLSSTEERAQEARIKAVEERRRRRLAVLLGATVILALVSIGGGYVWMQAQRAERVAETERLFEAQHAKALGEQEAGRYADALTTARDALGLIEAADIGGGLLARAESFAENAELRLSQFEQRQAIEERNAALLQRFEDLRLKSADFSKERKAIDAEYVATFSELGIDMQAEDLAPALDAMFASGMEEGFAFALDDWAMIKRRLVVIDKGDAWEAERLFLLASDLDPDPLRKRLREAILATDRSALTELAGEEVLADLPPATIWVLARVLWANNEHDSSRRLLEHAVRLHPDNFILNFGLGWLLRSVDREDLGIRYTTVARALRPQNAFIHGHTGDVLNALGEFSEAWRAYHRAAELAPEWDNMAFGIGTACLWLGKYEEMLVARERELALIIEQGEETEGDLEIVRAEILAARYLLDEASLDDVRDVLWDEVKRQNRLQVAYAMVTHPDPARRDPQAVLRAARRRVGYDARNYIARALVVMALRELGEHEQVLAALDEAEAVAYDVSRVQASFLAIERAAAYHHLGETESARLWFDRAKTSVELLTYAHPEDWERAPLVLRYRETAELLGL